MKDIANNFPFILIKGFAVFILNGTIFHELKNDRVVVCQIDIVTFLKRNVLVVQPIISAAAPFRLFERTFMLVDVFFDDRQCRNHNAFAVTFHTLVLCIVVHENLYFLAVQRKRRR